MSTSSFTLSEDFGSAEVYLKARESFLSAERALGYESKVKKLDVEDQAQEVVRKLKKWEDCDHYCVRPDG